MKIKTAPRPARIGPHSRLTGLWRAIFASIILDGVITTLKPAILPTQAAQEIAILCAIITLPFLDQERLARGLCRLRDNFATKTGSAKLPPKAAIIAGVLLALAIKLFLLADAPIVFAVLIGIILILGALTTIQHFLKAINEQRQLMISSPWSKVRLWESQIVTFGAVPIIAARLPSLIGALSISSDDQISTSLIYLATTVFLLVVTKPKRSAYIGSCRKCRAPAPIAYVSYGSCPNCDADLREMWS